MKIDLETADDFLNHAIVQKKLSAKVIINRKYDVPGLAVCSKNGQKVYIDRDVIGPNEVLKNYAVVRKTLRDVFKLHPSIATALASYTLVDHADLFRMQVKHTNSCRLKKLPPDIDMKGFSPKQSRQLRSMAQFQKNNAEKRKKLLTKQDKKSKLKGITNVDREFGW